MEHFVIAHNQKSEQKKKKHNSNNVADNRKMKEKKTCKHTERIHGAYRCINIFFMLFVVSHYANVFFFLLTFEVLMKYGL